MTSTDGYISHLSFTVHFFINQLKSYTELIHQKLTLRKEEDMEEKTAHEYEMFSCLQNTDGRQGDASGRTKNSEQSSVQQLKAQRNPEEIRKQRVNI